MIGVVFDSVGMGSLRTQVVKSVAVKHANFTSSCGLGRGWSGWRNEAEVGMGLDG